MSWGQEARTLLTTVEGRAPSFPSRQLPPMGSAGQVTAGTNGQPRALCCGKVSESPLSEVAKFPGCFLSGIHSGPRAKGEPGLQLPALDPKATTNSVELTAFPPHPELQTQC